MDALRSCLLLTSPFDDYAEAEEKDDNEVAIKN